MNITYYELHLWNDTQVFDVHNLITDQGDSGNIIYNLVYLKLRYTCIK